MPWQHRSKRAGAIRILYVHYGNPGAFPPLINSARILARNGHKVRVLGLREATGSRELHFISHPNIEAKFIRPHSRGWRQKLGYIRFVIWCGLQALLWKPRWVYASDFFSTPAALSLSFITSIAYHEHDFPLSSRAYARGQSLFTSMITAARKIAARRAKFCVTPSNSRADLLRQSTGTKRNILTVWNCPSLDEVSSSSASVKESDELILFYHGTIVPPRLPLTLIEALARSSRAIHLRIVGYETVGHPGYLETLLSHSRELGLEKRVTFLGAMSRSMSMAACRQAHIGVSLFPLTSEDVNEQTMIGASNKPFDYLACGLALLVPRLRAWTETFVDPGYGVGCNPAEVESIVEALAVLTRDRKQTRAMGAAGRAQVLAGWNYERQFQPVYDRLCGDARAEHSIR